MYHCYHFFFKLLKILHHNSSCLQPRLSRHYGAQICRAASKAYPNSLHFSIVISLFPVLNLAIMPEQLRSASLYQHQPWHMKCVLWFLIFLGGSNCIMSKEIVTLELSNFVRQNYNVNLCCALSSVTLTQSHLC